MPRLALHLRWNPLLALLLVLLQGTVLVQAAFSPESVRCECSHPDTVDCDCPHHRTATKGKRPHCHVRRKPPQHAGPEPSPAIRNRCSASRPQLHLVALATVPRLALAPLPAPPERDAPFPPSSGGPRETPLPPERPPPRA